MTYRPTIGRPLFPPDTGRSSPIFRTRTRPAYGNRVQRTRQDLYSRSERSVEGNKIEAGIGSQHHEKHRAQIRADIARAHNFKP